MRSLLKMSLIFAIVLYIDYTLSMQTIHNQNEIKKAALEKSLQIATIKKKVINKIIKKSTSTKKIIKKKPITQKKKNFFALVVPAIEHVHHQQIEKFERIKKALEFGTDQEEIRNLKKRYRVKSNHGLLLALKPHPQSIVIAQAAIESGWGTSRFFREANNIFGMWSKYSNEPRIAAGIKRGGKKTIWLKKFATLDESIRQYYRTIGRGKHYKAFRELRYKTDDVNLLVKKLDKYSELGDEYTRRLSTLIRHNKLTKYDK